MVTKLCLVGAGSIGRRHLRLLSERNDVALCVAEPNPVCRNAVTAEFPQFPLYHTMEEAVRAEQCHGAIIATPHGTHAALSIRALELGLHVFCEKPMSDSLEDCVRMLEAAENSDRIFSVGFMFRFDPFVRKVKSLITDGRIGRILHYASRFATYNTLLCSVTQHQRNTPYSLVMDCIHDSDLLYYFTERIPDYAYANAYQAGELERTSPQNFMDTVYRWQQGDLGAHIHFNYVQHPQIHDLQIVGEKGYILGDFMSSCITVGSIDGTTEQLCGLREDFNDVYRAQWDHFLRAIRGEVPPENPPRQAIVSTLLMHAQIASGKSGKEVDIHAIAKACGYQY